MNQVIPYKQIMPRMVTHTLMYGFADCSKGRLSLLSFESLAWAIEMSITSPRNLFYWLTTHQRAHTNTGTSCPTCVHWLLLYLLMHICISFLSPPVHFAQWAHMRRFLSVCPYGLDQKSDWIIIHISGCITARTLKHGLLQLCKGDDWAEAED